MLASAGLRVVHECGVPRRHDQVGRQIRQPLAQHLVALLCAEWFALAAEQLRDGGAVGRQQCVGGRRRRTPP